MTHAKQMLTKIESELEELQLTTHSYSIASRSMVKRRIDELLTLRNYYKNEVKMEELTQKKLAGECLVSFETKF